MVKYVKVDFIYEPTNQNMTRLFMILSNDFFFKRFYINNGIIIRSITEVEPMMWHLVPKNKKQAIILGKEVLK